MKQQNSTPPVTPTGQIVNLIPKTITQTTEPKFVPYEPYKAAIRPIVPLGKKKKRSKNNLDINVMVSQLTHLKTEETKKDNQKDNIVIHVDSEIETSKKQYEA